MFYNTCCNTEDFKTDGCLLPKHEAAGPVRGPLRLLLV